jgi:hypothetical protein
VDGGPVQTGQLDSKVPPTITFNPKSGFAGLGEELWHAWQIIKGGYVPKTPPDGTSNDWIFNWDVWAIEHVQDKRESQYKQ